MRSLDIIKNIFILTSESKLFFLIFTHYATCGIAIVNDVLEQIELTSGLHQNVFAWFRLISNLFKGVRSELFIIQEELFRVFVFVLSFLECLFSLCIQLEALENTFKSFHLSLLLSIFVPLPHLLQVERKCVLEFVYKFVLSHLLLVFNLALNAIFNLIVERNVVNRISISCDVLHFALEIYFA